MRDELSPRNRRGPVQAAYSTLESLLAAYPTMAEATVALYARMLVDTDDIDASAVVEAVDEWIRNEPFPPRFNELLDAIGIIQTRRAYVNGDGPELKSMLFSGMEPIRSSSRKQSSSEVIKSVGENFSLMERLKEERRRRLA